MIAVAADSLLRLSVIIPTLNEAESIVATLNRLQAMRKRGHEVIVSDGGSKDNTVQLCIPLVDRVVKTETGRARQMNAGVKSSQGNVFWFLHADTLIEPDHDQLIIKTVTENSNRWGRFDVQLSGTHPLLRIIERLMNWRSCLTGIATGDQGIFVQRELFEDIGGFASIPLMEDIEISKRLRKRARPFCIRKTLVTSSRRWEKSGILKTILLMWRLRLLFALGVDANRLARYYR